MSSSTFKGVVNTKSLRVEDLLLEELPQSYENNQSKEQVCLEYVANFYDQFQKLNPNRAELLLTPRNERNVEKFVCTTIRPTLLPYREMYDLENCATFVANIIEYEPLLDPIKLPNVVPSPTSVLKWQSGDAFDMANLLVSFLIGAGYDAYVVSGYAPKWVTLLDESNTECPMLVEKWHSRDGKMDAKAESKEDVENVFRPAPIVKVESEYLKYLESKANQEERPEEYQDEKEEKESGGDELEGRRVHAWVLVRAGRRGMKEHVFVEANTGQLYSVEECPYQGIESIWNNKNYYVNMQVDKRVQDTMFNLTIVLDWEFVMIEKKGPLDLEEAEEKESDDHGLTEKLVDPAEENVLDIPKSWVDKIVVTHDIVRKKYCNDGESVTLYKKVKLEQYAEGAHDHGIVTRLTLFKDVQRTIPMEVREYFQNRRDKLEYRIRFPYAGKLHEHFAQGRPEGLEDRIEYYGTRRELTFYPGARIDGLVRKEEEFLVNLTDIYQDRDDGLVYRSISLSDDKKLVGSKNTYTIPNGTFGELAVTKMVEKFSQIEYHGKEMPRKRTYHRDGRMHIQYHYAKGRITARSILFHKSSPHQVDINDPDPKAIRPKDNILEEQYMQTLQLEKDCYSSARHSELESQDLIKLRKRQESKIILEKTIFDAARENASDSNRNEKSGSDEKENEVRQADYLTPFLQHVHDMSSITKEEAQGARDNCLKALKERLLERANIIQTRLDNENAELAKKQAAFQRSQRDQDPGNDNEFEKFCSEAMFRISILEQRLTRHEETALQKYADLDQKLHHDPRLSIAFR